MILQARDAARSLASGRYMELRYEDFVVEPALALDAVFRFTGLPESDPVLRYMARLPRLENRNHKYLNMAREQIDLMNRVMGDTLERCGYPRA